MTAALSGPVAVRGSAASLVRRFAVGVAGEGLQSAFHFAVNVVLLRGLPAVEYGVFAIIFTGGSFALTYAHALVALPALVGMPGRRRRVAVDALDVVLGSAASAFAGAAGLVAAALVVAGTGSVAVAAAAGAFVSGWSLRHYVRSALVARGFSGLAASSDAAFAGAGSLGLALAVAVAPEAERLPAAFAALAAGNVAGIAAGLLGQRGRPVRVSGRRSVRARYRSIWRSVGWSLVGVTTVNVQAQAQTVLVALLAGPGAFAPVAAALVLLSPLRIAMSALVALVQPDFVRALAAGDVERVRGLLGRLSGVAILCCLGYGGALFVAFPALRAVLFPRFAGEPMGLVTALSWATALLFLTAALPKALAEAAGRFRAVARATTVSMAVGIAAVAGLLVVAGPAWSLAGVAAAEIVSLCLLWRVAADAVAARRSTLLVARAIAQPGKRRLR